MESIRKSIKCIKIKFKSWMYSIYLIEWTQYSRAIDQSKNHWSNCESLLFNFLKEEKKICFLEVMKWKKLILWKILDLSLNKTENDVLDWC